MSNEDKGVNRDPITGTPGAHPIGTGLGAAAGGMAAGAAVGTFAGPIGTVAGAAVGAVAGALAGKGIAEKIDPTIEEAYWRENYVNRTYVTSGSTFDDYGPAYVYGVDNYSKHPGQKFDDISAFDRDIRWKFKVTRNEMPCGCSAAHSWRRWASARSTGSGILR